MYAQLAANSTVLTALTKLGRHRYSHIVPAMNQTICSAITSRHVLELRYHGYSRLVEPYAYGRDKNGEELLRCYQRSGGSESGQGIGWKLLKIADIYSTHSQITNFVPHHEYRRGDKAMAYIFCEV